VTSLALASVDCRATALDGGCAYLALRSLDARVAAPDGGSTSTRRPWDPWWAVA
jgi:hypothetical protein